MDVQVLSAVGRTHQIRRAVVEAVTVYGDVGGVGIEVGRLDNADLRPGGEALRRDLHPVAAAVARTPDQTVVGAGPDVARVERGDGPMA